MRKPIKTLAQLKDSQLLYDKNPPPFGTTLIIMVALLIIAVIIWSIHTPRTYVVKSNGVVISAAKNYIMSAYTGEIVTANVIEGDYVEKGEVLFLISSTELDLQAKQIKGMIDVNKEKIRQYKRLEACIKDGTNLFDENKEQDKPYYYQYETYISQISQKELDASSYKTFNYTDEQIISAIKSNEAAVAEIYYTTLKIIAETMQSLQTEIDGYEVQLASVNSGKAEYPITASTSGLIHMDIEYKEGMIVQAASSLGTIVNEKDSYYVMAYTAANDMPLINLGDQVDIAVSGLNQSIYGTIGGNVVYIASEATADSESKTSSFLMRIALDTIYLISNTGSKVNLSNGMAVEARIHYDEVTYFNYVLEAMGILMR